MKRSGKSSGGSQQAKRTRSARRASANDHAKLEYKTIRDRFLLAYSQQGSNEVEWLVEVGKFVQYFWLKEEQQRIEDQKPDHQFDDREYLELWDDCTEGTLRRLRTEAGKELQSYWQKKRLAALLASVRHAPWLRWFGWLAKEAFRGFVGGIGLIILGLLLVLAAPLFAQQVRTVLDDLLPAATQPSTDTPAE